MKKYTTLLLISCLLSISCMAWNARGHKLIASIAYDQLGQTRKAMFTELLERHPYSEEWMKTLRNLEAMIWEDIYLCAPAFGQMTLKEMTTTFHL